MKKILTWVGGAALLYLAYRFVGGRRPAVLANGGTPPSSDYGALHPALGTNGDVITNATNLAASVKSNPALGAILGLSQQAIDRITLSASQYANLYQMAPVNSSGDTRPITNTNYFPA